MQAGAGAGEVGALTGERKCVDVAEGTREADACICRGLRQREGEQGEG